jgi:acyl-CoA reductase-like NAD-dependent aldehyde dehydrogenase
MAGVSEQQRELAGSRLVVHEDVTDALVERVVARARTIRIGNPLDPETEMGPMATDKQYHTVLGHFASAREQGPRERRGRHRRGHRDQVGVGRAHRRHPGPVHPRMTGARRLRRGA